MLVTDQANVAVESLSTQRFTNLGFRLTMILIMLWQKLSASDSTLQKKLTAWE